MAAIIPEITAFFQQQNFVRKFHKGQLIFAQGEIFDYVFLINSGMVKSYDIDDSGTERTLAIFGRGSVFPLIWLIKPKPTEYLYYYEAFSDTTCYLANVDACLRFVSANPEVLSGVASAVVRAYIDLVSRVRSLERSHIHERLEFVLYSLAVRLGSFNDDGTIAAIDAPITQEDISKLAGVTRESISLELNRASAKSMIWKDGHRTYIDVSRLSTADLPAM
jgi:CRP-like cAMP-binding protein